MKYIITGFLLHFFVTFIYSQVGINNNTPISDLDVNGDVTLRGGLYLDGSDTEKGNPGVAGQVLVSSGAGSPPRWQRLNIPDSEEFKHYLIYNNTYDDEVGAGFSSTETSGVVPYVKGTALSSLSNWKPISGLSGNFEIFSNENKTYFTFETVAQITSSLISEAVEYACGIFVDGKLEGVRTNTLAQTGSAVNTFQTMTMLLVTESLSKGNHTVNVACTRRANYNTSANLGIGRSVASSNLNNFMSRSTLKIEVFEIPEEYIDILP